MPRESRGIIGYFPHPPFGHESPDQKTTRTYFRKKEALSQEALVDQFRGISNPGAPSISSRCGRGAKASHRKALYDFPESVGNGIFFAGGWISRRTGIDRVKRNANVLPWLPWMFSRNERRSISLATSSNYWPWKAIYEKVIRSKSTRVAKTRRSASPGAARAYTGASNRAFASIESHRTIAFRSA